MDVLENFEEIAVDKNHLEFIIPVKDVIVHLNVKYFLNRSGIGYCSLLINEVKGKGLKGMIEALAAKVYVRKKIFVFLSLLEDGKKLITVPDLFEKKSHLDEKIDISDFIINRYDHNNFKKTVREVYEEHMNVLKGKRLSNNNAYLSQSILELPGKGIELIRSVENLYQGK